MTKSEVQKRLCQLVAKVNQVHFKHSIATDCFCGQSVEDSMRNLFAFTGFQFEEEALVYIEKAVEEKLGVPLSEVEL